MEQNTIEQLKSLKALLDSDILNQEEFEKEKAKLLSKPVVADTISVQISKEENETSSNMFDKNKLIKYMGVTTIVGLIGIYLHFILLPEYRVFDYLITYVILCNLAVLGSAMEAQDITYKKHLKIVWMILFALNFICWGIPEDAPDAFTTIAAYCSYAEWFSIIFIPILEYMVILNLSRFVKIICSFLTPILTIIIPAMAANMMISVDVFYNIFGVVSVLSILLIDYLILCVSTKSIKNSSVIFISIIAVILVVISRSIW